MQKTNAQQVAGICVHTVQSVENCCTAVYKPTDTVYNYLSPAIFKELAQTEQQYIAGYTQIKQYTLTEECARKQNKPYNVVHFLKQTLTDEGKPVNVIGLRTKLADKKPAFTYTKGYLKVGLYTYVQLCKSFLPILLIILFAIAMVTTVVVITKPTPAPPYVEEDPNYDEDQQDWDDNDTIKSGKDSESSIDTTSFPGYSQVYITNATETIALVNPAVNTVDFTYTLVDADGYELYTTSKIRPGKYVPFSIGKLYPNYGSYALTFIVRTYDTATGVECTSVTMPITLTVGT